MGLKRVSGIGLFKFQEEKEKKDSVLNTPNQVADLGKALTQERIKSMQQSQVITNMGKEQTKSKLENMNLKNELNLLKDEIENLKGGN